MAISLTEFMQNMKHKEQHEIKKPISEIVDRNGFIGRIPPSKCLHKLCSQCHGNGVKTDGTICVHYISCNCATCTTYSM